MAVAPFRLYTLYLFEAEMFFGKIQIEGKPKPFSVCVLAYVGFGHIWSLIVLSDVLESHSWSDYEDKGVGFNSYTYAVGG